MHVRDISSMGICTVTACAGLDPGIAKDQFWASYSETTKKKILKKKIPPWICI